MGKEKKYAVQHEEKEECPKKTKKPKRTHTQTRTRYFFKVKSNTTIKKNNKGSDEQKHHRTCIDKERGGPTPLIALR